jgi:hypothetical protein
MGPRGSISRRRGSHKPPGPRPLPSRNVARRASPKISAVGRLPRVRRKILFATIVALLLADSAARHRSVRRTERPGLLIVQIDGLSLPALRSAMARGHTPFLAGLLERREAALTPWAALLPPTTPASQAAILHGSNANIPGFRWYEKSERRLLVANHPGDASDIQRRVSDGHGLLADGGASIGNLLTGDAIRSYLTMATVAEEPRTPGTLIRLRTFLVSPVNGVRIALGMISQFERELYQAWRQERERVEPRMARGLGSALERALLNSMVRGLSTELVIAEMRMGTPVIYVDYTGYDVVAHHAGPERPEALHSIRGIDRAIHRLTTAATTAARPYRLVVLSDHGQSLGTPFATQYGQRLDEFVAAGMGTDVFSTHAEDTEHGHLPSAIARDVARGLGLLPIGVGAAGLLRAAASTVRSGAHRADREPDIVVCASGNLAHLYFTATGKRMTMQEIEGRYPGLHEHLLGHPAVGVLVVRDANDGPIVIGRDGRRELSSGHVVGADPLDPYGSLAERGLRRLDSFTNTGDIVAISRVDEESGQVTSFETLVGCHGGLGGQQSEAFVLHPSEWDVGPQPLEGADAVHRVLREWIESLRP